MASVAQIEANRLNAQKSTGPRTPEGKERASRNAVKHGLLAEQVVIHGEDPAEFDGYRDRMLGELAPVGEVEEMLAERAVSLAWRLRRAERLQSAVFARVYRENADDIVLWPKHGLPIQPGPDEEEVILGQVVMADFGHAKVLDRLVVYERRIEGSFYRTMAELRREKRARVAEEGQGSRHAGTPTTKPCRTLRSGGRVAEEGACTPTTGELGSFGEEAERTPYGVTTNPLTCGNHGRDARATGTPTGGDHGRDARATGASANGDHGRDARATDTPTGGDHGRDGRATNVAGTLGSFGADAAPGTQTREAASDRPQPPDGAVDSANIPIVHHSSPILDVQGEGGWYETNPISGGRSPRACHGASEESGEE